LRGCRDGEEEEDELSTTGGVGESSDMLVSGERSEKQGQLESKENRGKEGSASSRMPALLSPKIEADPKGLTRDWSLKSVPLGDINGGENELKEFGRLSWSKEAMGRKLVELNTFRSSLAPS